jgi:hypothetical protein
VLVSLFKLLAIETTDIWLNDNNHVQFFEVSNKV